MNLKMRHHYILDGKNPVLCEDVLEWASINHQADPTVAITVVGDIKVSTVFLRQDLNFGRGDLAVFETMVFSDESAWHPDGKYRYSTWDEAASRHEVICDEIRAQQQRAEKTVKKIIDSSGFEP